MQTRYKVIISIVIVTVAFASGRYTTPTKTVIETKIVEVEKKQTKEDVKKDRNKKTTVVEISKPNGEKQTTTTIDETVVLDRQRDTTVTKDTTKESESKTVTGDSKTSINAMFGIDFDGKTPVYGGSVSKPVVGPIAIGIFGLTNKTLGCTIGVVF